MAKKTIQEVFERYEQKYLLDPEQYAAVRRGLDEHMRVDEYGRHTICNVYFDTADYELIRGSIEQPLYKEKLRLRSYGVPSQDDVVFAELKKKFDGVVYKRRFPLTAREAGVYFDHGEQPERCGQIQSEIDWFMRLYKPEAKVCLAYDRLAMFGLDDDEIRVTFDQNIRWRKTHLDLTRGDWGSPLLEDERVLMEIKTPGAAPLWLSHLLSGCGAFKTTFSKYGVCYKKFLIKDFLKTGVSICA